MDEPEEKLADDELKIIKEQYIEAAKNDSFLFGDYDYETLWKDSISNDVL